MSKPSRVILMTAGDVSGDVHTAELARTLLARDPSHSLHVLGGSRLQAAALESPGGQVLGNTTDCSAIGIHSAIQIYFRCWQLRSQLRQFLDQNHVDLAVLCDWGAFNGRIVHELHARGIPVLYYFPPRSWQQGGTSGLGIVPSVTRVATPFAWSAEQLRAAGCPAEWVGHPSVAKVRPPGERAALRLRFGVQPEEKLVALMPASRQTEINVLAPRLAKAAELVTAQRPVRFIAVLPHELASEARARFPASIPVVTDCATDLLLAADAAIVKTGTASLEAVLAGVPHLTVYDFSVPTRIEWLLLWAWKRIPFYAMPNIILQREAIPELLGLKCQPDRIAATVQCLLDDGPIRRQMLQDYELVRRALGSELPTPATERTAEIVEEMLQAIAAPALAPA
ncbi:MAG: hypothetical protein ABI946_06250 [Chthoniobacterales bacterium]